LQVLRLLGDGERCVCEIAAAIGAKQPLLSFHLKTLRDAELVVATRRGRWVYYGLNGDALRELGGFLQELVDGRVSESTMKSESTMDEECCRA
jgi:ArsR family transcriptional regulator